MRRFDSKLHNNNVRLKVLTLRRRRAMILKAFERRILDRNKKAQPSRCEQVVAIATKPSSWSER